MHQRALVWSVPIKRTALDGIEYNLILLDSKGIDAYDQMMGGIDEATLDRLSLVIEMTKHIRDFYLDLTEDNRKITPRDYLELALRPHAVGKDVSAKNEV
ncbi:Guanylate-binding protein 3 [Bienertia sinuspersici]